MRREWPKASIANHKLTIQENSATTFRMLGPWYGLLTGTHVFDFQPYPIPTTSTTSTSPTSEQTLFTQSESFTGVLSYFMDSPSSMGGKKTLAAFEEVNADLKRYAEAKWRDGRPGSATSILSGAGGRFSDRD